MEVTTETNLNHFYVSSSTLLRVGKTPRRLWWSTAYLKKNRLIIIESHSGNEYKSNKETFRTEAGQPIHTRNLSRKSA